MKKFKQFLNETIIGININDDTAPWTDMILSGKKTIETRTNTRLSKYIGKRVGLVKTSKKGKAVLVGYATVGEPIKYDSPEAFNKDFDKHQVSPDNAFFNGGIKYGYPLTDVKKCEPKLINTEWKHDLLHTSKILGDEYNE